MQLLLQNCSNVKFVNLKDEAIQYDNSNTEMSLRQTATVWLSKLWLHSAIQITAIQ